MFRSYTSRLYRWRGDLYDLDGSDRLFRKALKENVRFHLRHNREYRKLTSRFHDAGTPVPVPAALFKSRPLWTVPPAFLPFLLTSSGTGGKKSILGFCFSDMLRGARMTLALTRHHEILSWKPVRYLILGFEPDRNNRTMISRTQRITSWFAPPVSRVYGLRSGHGRFRPDFLSIVSHLEAFSKGPFPVRIIGFPSYVFFLLCFLEQHGIRYSLPRGSMVLLGGGWKGYEGNEVSRDILYEKLQKILDIPESSCREFFGAAEHPALYCACPNRHFHVPFYSRARIRDAVTLKPLGYGQPGLLELITPLARAMPLASILTGDMAILHRGSSCGCGISSPYFELLGRAESLPGKTCAADAAELLKHQSCMLHTDMPSGGKGGICP